MHREQVRSEEGEGEEVGELQEAEGASAIEEHEGVAVVPLEEVVSIEGEAAAGVGFQEEVASEDEGIEDACEKQNFEDFDDRVVRRYPMNLLTSSTIVFLSQRSASIVRMRVSGPMLRSCRIRMTMTCRFQSQTGLLDRTTGKCIHRCRLKPASPMT